MCMSYVFEMNTVINCHSLFALYLTFLIIPDAIDAGNLTCYQCIKDTNIECDLKDLLPCPSVSDRCVTHISKNAEKGFSIKRECGLGPCGFDDDMVNKGLGFGSCDRSKDEYFCIICCRENGCNKNKSSTITTSTIYSYFMVFSILLIYNIFVT